MIAKLSKAWGPHPPGTHITTSLEDARAQGIEAAVLVDPVRFAHMTDSKLARELRAPAFPAALSEMDKPVARNAAPPPAEDPAVDAGDDEEVQGGR